MPTISSRLLVCSTVASLLLCCLSIVVLVQTSFNTSNFLSAQWNVQEISSERHLASASKSSNASSLSRSSKSMDWFDKERWLATESQLNCFYVENICHGDRQYFYDEIFGGKNVQQPQWKIDRSTNAKQKHFYNSPGHSISIGVEEMAGQEQSCFYSPIENHIVLHGSHNGMLGEFYARVLPGLKHMMETLVPGEDQRRWQEGTQLYLDAWKSLPYFHYGPMDNLLDSHHLFLRPFTSNPVLQLRSLQENTGCSCMKRLFFCGYEKVNKTDSKPIYRPGTGVMDDRFMDKDVSWRDLRDFLRNTTISNDPKIQQIIKTTRTEMITNLGGEFGTKSSEQGIKIVGLAQRNGRRRWTNLEETLALCNGLSPNVICVEVNVEKEESHAVSQVVTFGALDMLMGIHGAQLTQGILMKDGAVVVELLPFIQHGDFGAWVSRLDDETPLGIIFRGTGLHHVGYPLGNNSLIYDESGSFGDKWAERDFRVDTTIIAEAVQSFLLVDSGADPMGDCKSFLERGVNFTLYNIHCEGALKHVYRSHWAEPNALCDKDNHAWCPQKERV